MAGIERLCRPGYFRTMAPDDRSSTSMNVSLPRSLRSFVDARVSDSCYTSASEYIRELIRKDRDQRSAQDRLESLVAEGIASGPAEPFEDDFFDKLKARVRAAKGETP